MEGCTRPVRIEAKSSRATSTALPIFLSASERVSLITTAPCSCPDGPCSGCGRPAFMWSGVARDRRTDLLTLYDARDVALGGQVEHDHVHVVVTAQADRRRVGYLEATGQELVVAEAVSYTHLRAHETDSYLV